MIAALSIQFLYARISLDCHSTFTYTLYNIESLLFKSCRHFLIRLKHNSRIFGNSHLHAPHHRDQNVTFPASHSRYRFYKEVEDHCWYDKCLLLLYMRLKIYCRSGSVLTRFG